MRPESGRATVLVAILASALLIIAAARGDLWLDEIWSLGMAASAEGAADLLLGFQHDNNHVLNTLYLYLLGDQAALIWYRLLAVISGIGSLFLVSLVAWRQRGPVEALIAVGLVGTSFPLLLYFSEARGYAPAVFFALLSFFLLEEEGTNWTLPRLLLLWCSLILGVLSHSTFVMVWVALLFVELWRVGEARESPRTELGGLLARQLPVLAFYVFWYLFFIRGMAIGGGPIYGKIDVLEEASSLLLGLPSVPPLSGLALVGVLAIVVAGSWACFREGGSTPVFYPGVLLLSPALFLLVMRPQYLYFRYLVVCFPFFYLLLSYLLGRSWKVWPARIRWLVPFLVAVLVGGQVFRVYPLLVVGRGDYSGVLERILECSPQGVIRVGSDHDFRNRMVLGFYAQRTPRGSALRYIEQEGWQEEKPDWLLAHSQDTSYQAPMTTVARGAGVYQLFGEYPFAGVSGWSWFLYRRVEGEEGVP